MKRALTPAEKLLQWYHVHGRDLPWRHTRDSYRILVSEMMLQQTQVNRVLFFYDRWLQQFPTWQTLASATNADVINTWAGLGYNRRALMLRDIAKQVCEGNLPTSEEEWRKLKGIGPYSAAALTVFSLEQRALPIDTNIRRVIGRFSLGIAYPDLKDDARILPALDAFTPTRKNYVDVPQALFDLATLVCTKTQPTCTSCPLAQTCKARAGFVAGTHATPIKRSSKPRERIHEGKKIPDRIFRGRILACVRTQPNHWTKKTIGPSIDPSFRNDKDQLWVEAMIERLIQDKLLQETHGKLHL